MPIKHLLFCGLAVAGLCASARAQIALVNGDFSQLGVEYSSAIGGLFAADGWTNNSDLNLQASISYTGQEGTPNLGEGTTYLRLASDQTEAGNPQDLGFIVQDLGTMIAGQTYTFTGTALGGNGSNIDWGATVQLTSDGSATPAIVYATTTLSGYVGGSDTPDALNISYTATAADNGNPLYIWLQAEATASGQAARGGFDDIELTTTSASAPEPTSFAFLSGGLVALGLARKLLRRCHDGSHNGSRLPNRM